MWLVGLCLAILVTGVIAPRPFAADEGRDLFCREDGYCLPPPVEMDEFLASQHEERDEGAYLPEILSCDVPLLVKRAAHVSPEAFREMLEEQGYTQIEGLLVPQWWRVCSPDVSLASVEIESLTSHPQIDVVERDESMSLFFVPNDPYYPRQWGLPKVQAPQAWALTRGSTDVLISIVDTGFDYHHPDRPVNAWLGWDFIHNDNDPWDDHGHGTHVAGIATAAGNNGIGISGLCPGCATLHVKAADYRGSVPVSASAQGIMFSADTATSLGKRAVINLSFGGAYSNLVADAVNYASRQGAVIIAAAGNSGAASPSYPAALSGVSAILATDSNDRRASFSQYGDFGAPGVGIFSTLPPSSYGLANGTSMAAPLVSGAAGLVWSHRPDYTPSQVIQALEENVDVPSGWNSQYGAGRLNVYRAMQQGGPSTPPPVRTPIPPEYNRFYLPMTIH